MSQDQAAVSMHHPQHWCFQSRVGIFSPGGFAVPVQPGVPQALSRGAARGARAEQPALQKRCAGSKHGVRPLPNTRRAHEHGPPHG